MNNIIEIEKQVIGTLLMNKGTALADVLNEDDFTAFPLTIKAIKQQLAEGNPVNMVTLYGKGRKEFNQSELAQIVSGVIQASLIEDNVRTLKKYSARRKLAQVLSQYVRLAPKADKPEELIAEVIDELQHIQTGAGGKTVTTSEAFLEYIKDYDRREKDKGNEMLIGLPLFDDITAGFHKGELTTIAARPGKGKTAFALQIAAALAKKHKILFVSLEMSSLQLVERLIVRYSKADHKKLRNAGLKGREWDDVTMSADEIAAREFEIDTTIRTVGELRAAAVNLRPDLIIIDHVGRMKDTGKFLNRREELGSITRKLKLMTLDFGTPIIMLSQLNRDAQTRRPTLAELRESGAIEEDSDNVIFLHRLSIDDAEDYGFSKDRFMQLVEREQHPSLIIIEKQRNGSVRDILTVFDPKRFEFVEIGRKT